MDESVIRAMAKWPGVPAVYGWLSLDRRGEWRLKGERITHRKATAFINRNYAGDANGCWYFQNGPQRVYVRLAYTPWVYRRAPTGELMTHTGELVEALAGAYLDEEGSLLLDTPKGIGVMDDRDLDAFSAHLATAGGKTDPDALEVAARDLQQGRSADLVLRFGGKETPVAHVQRARAPARFGFNPEPGSGAGKG